MNPTSQQSALLEKEMVLWWLIFIMKLLNGVSE